jgi:ubiquinone/menaquinone biosynthesis C-methylase UbiE
LFQNEVHQPRLYTEFAQWFHLLTSPADYAVEAEFFAQLFTSHAISRPKTVLELGCGGGNNASFLKQHFQMTLSDVSHEMLNVSSTLNPECDHIQGDMRSLRLNRLFDAVFIHDAISYMTTEADLQAAIETAFVHCGGGGVAVFAPDFVRETFVPFTKRGGHDGDNRSMRYLEWTWDPDPADTTYLVEFAFLFRWEDGRVTCECDRHRCGMFPESLWFEMLHDVGFMPQRVPFIEDSTSTDPTTDVFIGTK